MASKKSGKARPKKPAKKGSAPKKAIPLNSTTIGAAILDLADLAIRHLTVDQRGRTSLAAKDADVLGRIVGALNTHRHSHAAAKVGKRAPILTPDMERIGWQRLAFDDLCTYAVEQPLSDKRDAVLAASLQLTFLSERFQITKHHILEAIKDLKRRAAAERRTDRKRPDDWLKTGERYSAIDGAGELLCAVMEQSPVLPSIDASPHTKSTAIYRDRARVQLRARTVRAVTPLERFGYLMTVLGVPIENVPWTSFQVAKLLAGESLIDRKPGEDITLYIDAPQPPTPFRLLDNDQKTRIVESVRQALIGAGVSESRLVGSVQTTESPASVVPFNRSWFIVDSFLADPTMWAGQVAGPVTDDLSRRTVNPWATNKP